jgi:hypothetical protein
MLILLGTALAWAQNPPASSSTAPAQTPSSGQGHDMAGMQQMHQQEMQDIQATLQKMHALLNSMRAAYSGMETRDQPAMQANIEMWQLMVDHMDKMVQRMQSMEHGGMQHHHEGPTPQK